MDREKCSGCPLEHIGVPVGTKGNPVAPIAVVVDCPGRHVAADGRLVSKPAMTVFSTHMDAAGYGKQDFLFIPQIRCPHTADEFSTKEKKLIQQTCRQHLEDELAELRPELIMPLGAEAAKQVMARAVKITKVRGIPSFSEEFGAQVFPMLSPSMVSLYPQHAVTFATDCTTLRRLQDNEYDAAKTEEELYGDYQIVDDLQFLIDQQPKLICFDTETTSLRYFYKGPHNVRDYDPAIHGKEFDPSAAILTMQFSIKKGEGYMLVWDHPENPIPDERKPELIRQLKALLCNPNTRVVNQNLKYDATYLYSQTGIRIKVGGDTLMLAALLDENSIAKGQDMLVKKYVPEMAGYADSFNATVDKSRMWEVPLQKLLGYGVGDVASGLQLYKALIKEVMADKKLFAHYRRVSLPGINTFVSMELRGVPVDYEALEAFEEIMAASVEEQRVALLAQVPKSIKRKHLAEAEAKKKGSADPLKVLSFSRGDFVRDILFHHKDGFRLKPKVFTSTTAKLKPEMRVPSTSSKDHLPYFFDDCPFTFELAQYVKDERLLGTNIRGFKKKYIFDDLIRSVYSLWTAVTGRTSCVKGDTPVVTARGIVRAEEVVVGDKVFTHARRWKPVTSLFRKPPALMYDLCLSNGEVLSVTAHHRVMLDSGLWADVGYVLEGMGYAVSEQAAHEGSGTCPQGSDGVQAGTCDSRGGSGQVWGQPCNGAGNDPCVYTGRSVRYAEGDTIPKVQIGGEEPAIRAEVGFRLRGWAGVPDTSGRREEVLYSQDSDGRLSGATPISATGELCGPSYRRESEEQRHLQPLPEYAGGASGYPRQVPDAGRGLVIEKVVCSGVHRVYDFEVAEDHSYLACGVFNHNSEDPNSQNFPKRGARAKAYRRIFRAPPGYFVLEADLSQAELRIAADMANDPVMLRIYQEAGDIHTATALIVVGMTIEEFKALPKSEQKDLRTKAKAVNFGYLYGMWWRKFIGYAKTQYGAEFTEKEAEQTRIGFFNKYRGLEPWHIRVKEFARKNKMVRSYSGRIRHLPMIDSEEEYIRQEAERQAVNSPVQGFGSDLGVMAMGRLNEEVDARYLAPIAFVHDAIYCLVPQQYLLWGAHTLKHYMESNPLEEWFGLKMKCPIVADVSFGENFGDTYEMPGLEIGKPYDFSTLWEEGKEGLVIPRQRIPPRAGRIAGSVYSTPDEID